VRLHRDFALSYRDVETLLAERGITVTHETIRQWCQTFGPDHRGPRRRVSARTGDGWRLSESNVTIQGRQGHLWCAVDQADTVIDLLVQTRRDEATASQFFAVVMKEAPAQRAATPDQPVDRSVAGVLQTGRRHLHLVKERVLRDSTIEVWRNQRHSSRGPS
jgi:transposase-like protein